MTKFQYIPMILIFSLSACGEFSYKRGATPRDLQMTKQTCQSAGGEAAIDKCLEDHGWIVQNLEDFGSFDSEDLFVETQISDNHTGEVVSKDSVVTEQKPAEITRKKVMSDQTPVKKDDLISKKKTVLVQKNNTSKPDVVKPTPSLLDTFKINSWWKLGAGRSRLDSDMASCTEKLGVAHQPDTKTQTMTRGLIICMKDKGWRALRAK